jgi:hypothetical protein
LRIATKVAIDAQSFSSRPLRGFFAIFAVTLSVGREPNHPKGTGGNAAASRAPQERLGKETLTATTRSGCVSLSLKALSSQHSAFSPSGLCASQLNLDWLNAEC